MTDASPAFAALSPLDGRYRADVAPLLPYFSEAALNRERIAVEVEWIIALCQRGLLPGAPQLTGEQIAQLRGLAPAFDSAEAARLAEIEARTVHDVKAVEYYLAEKIAELPGLPPGSIHPALIHFALTSEDVNNLAYALNVAGALSQVWLPAARRLVEALVEMAHATASLPMLSRTHGQPASPTTLGKEIAVFAARLDRQLRRIEAQQVLGKFSGATGTFGAHLAAAPEVDWAGEARSFVEGLGLAHNPLTTQIESHDWLSELFADLVRFGRIAHNLATDIWAYIAIGHFRQAAAPGAVGSSTMPHKINPIRFENAEANLEVSNALFETLAATLVTSRWQRDLTDSTTLRNVGVAFGHSLLALNNLVRGLATLEPDAAALAADLDANWEVLAEPVQTVMRAAAIAGHAGFDDPYERLKELTRGKRLDAEGLAEFVRGLGLPAEAAERLLALTPATYTGLAADLVETHLPRD